MKTIHMGISVRGMARQSLPQLKKLMSSCTKGDGTKFKSIDEFRNHLFDLISEGKEILPFGNSCPTWDYKNGCPGHDVTSSQESS